MNTILLIENNNAILDNLTELFELEGYHILIASNGLQGIELARIFIPDLIICDILMAKMDGLEVLHSILQTACTNKIPFIFSTCMSEKNDKIIALKAGADDYIVKPYNPEILLAMAKKWILSGTKRL